MTESTFISELLVQVISIDCLVFQAVTALRRWTVLACSTHKRSLSTCIIIQLKVTLASKRIVVSMHEVKVNLEVWSYSAICSTLKVDT